MFSTVFISTAVDPEVWIIMVTSRNSMIQVMLDQEYDPELYDEWLTSDELLTCFIKAREKISVRVKVAESPSVQGDSATFTQPY